jgi:hypothetical protein
MQRNDVFFSNLYDIIDVGGNYLESIVLNTDDMDHYYYMSTYFLPVGR